MDDGMTSLVARERESDAELPDFYDPEVSLLKVAAADEALKRFRRAKNVEGLFAAVETKLREQRHFVRWWDEQEKQPAGRPPKIGNRSVTDYLKPEEFGLDKMTLSRWRRRLGPEDAYRSELERARERCRMICEADRSEAGGSTGNNSASHEWHTPQEHVEAARRVLGGIDLDPASNEEAQQKIGAERYYTKDDDGLSRPWSGRVFLNPPYSQPALGDFVRKLCDEYRAGLVTEAVLLTNNSADAEWCQGALRTAAAACFVAKRIRFVRGGAGLAGNPLIGQIFFYFGRDVASFAREFCGFGTIMIPFLAEIGVSSRGELA